MSNQIQSQQRPIVGRYAPSPTGDLHLGNLRTALIAWLHARLQGGTFLLRMEDLDVPRTVDGSADQILRDLEWLGLDWDGEVVYQSAREPYYQAALESLEQQGLVYQCFCSRKDIQQAVSAPHSSTGVYPGTCESLTSQQIEKKRQQKAPALRLRVQNSIIEFKDGCLGNRKESLAQTVGDFVIKRADGLFAYQLAVIVDDLEQGVTEVVRGADLIDSTLRQIYLAQKLSANQNRPNYWHVPLLMDNEGKRMAKRDGSQSVQNWCDEGGPAEKLIGELASSLRLCPDLSVISLTDLLNSLDFETFTKAIQSH